MMMKNKRNYLYTVFFIKIIAEINLYQISLYKLSFKNQEIFCKKCENKNKSICSNMFQKTYVDNKHQYKYAPEDVIYFIREDLLGKYPEENKRA